MDSCVVNVQGEAPTYLLAIAGWVFASLVAVTLFSWHREASKRSAREVRSDEAAAAAAAAGKGKGKRKAKTYPEYTMDAVHSHCTAKDAWVAIGDGVYDVTKWAPHHPGGERNIVDISGRWESGREREEDRLQQYERISTYSSSISTRRLNKAPILSHRHLVIERAALIYCERDVSYEKSNDRIYHATLRVR